MNKSDIIILVTNDVSTDTRVSKIKHSLAQHFQTNLHCFSDPEKTYNDDIDVRRLVKYRKIGSYKKLRQFITYFLFILKNLFYSRSSHSIYANDLDCLVVAYLMKIFNRNLTLIYDSHELHTDTHWNYKKKLKRYFIFLIEKIMIKKVDIVITVSPGIASILNMRHQLDCIVLPNSLPRYDCALEDQNLSDTPEHILSILGDNKKKLCVFHGGLTLGRGIEEILEIAHLEKFENVDFLFIGDGPLKNSIREANAKNIFHLSYIEHAQLLIVLRHADFGFILYKTDCLNHKLALPNKLFEYAMCNVVTVYDDMTEVDKLCKDHCIGIPLQEFLKNSGEDVYSENDREKWFSEFNRSYNWNTNFLPVVREIKKRI